MPFLDLFVLDTSIFLLSKTALISIRFRQIFSGGYRTKMKIWSENFLRASGAQKKGSQIFRLRRAFFVVEALKTAKKPLKTAKNRKIFLKTTIF